MDLTVGTCGNCLGPVKVPTTWHSVNPPTPVCAHCGAAAKPNYGPVMAMEPAKTTVPYGGKVEIEIHPDGTAKLKP